MINSRVRKYSARFLLPILTVWLCVVPGRVYAQSVPIPVIGATAQTTAQIIAFPGAAIGGGEVGAAGASVGGAGFFVGAGAFAVGMAIGYFGLEALLGDGSTAHVRIPLTSAPAAAVPAPSAPSTAPGVPVYNYYASFYSFGGSGSTAQLACNSLVVSIYGAGKVGIATETSCAIGNGCTGDCTALISKTATGSTTCPAGYALSGSTCVLSNARTVTPDKACDFERSGSALAMISDPDCAASGQVIPTLCSGDGVSCTGQGVSPSGQPRSYSIVTLPNGGSIVQTYEQRSVNGQTQVQSSMVTISPAGIVESVSGDIQAGSIPSSSTGAAVAPVTSSSTLQQEAPQLQPVTFPSDYARTGEAAAAANALSPKLDTLHRDLSDTVSTIDPTVPIVDEMPTWGNSFTNLLGWRVPAHASACPQPSMDLSGVLGPGSVYVMNSHCTLLNDNAAPLHNSMVVVFTMLALFVVLRA